MTRVSKLVPTTSSALTPLSGRRLTTLDVNIYSRTMGLNIDADRS